MQHNRREAVSQVHEELVQLARELMTGERPADGVPTFALHAVLSYIARNPGCRATDVSGAFAVHRSTVSRQLRQCVDSGWVRVVSGPLRLGRPLSLTDVGAEVLAAADHERRAQVQARVETWSTDDVADFAEMLHRFRSPTPPTRTPSDTPGDHPHA